MFGASVHHHDRVRAICVYQHSVGKTVWRWLLHGESSRTPSLTRTVEADDQVREDVLSPPAMGPARPTIAVDEVYLRVVPELNPFFTERLQADVVETPYSA